MEILQNLLENTQYSFLSALILGLMTAISPCPLATNISAIGFISRDLNNRNKVFVSGLIYTLGRALSYTLLAIIIYFGASKMDISNIFQGWGEKILGPLLIVIGILMFDFVKIKLPTFSKLTENLGEKSKTSYWSTLFLGMAFALAFCPYSAVLYFVMLIPLTLSSQGGLVLPVIYAIATGLPVIIFSWLLAYALNGVGKLYNSLQLFERWFRRIVALIFIIAGSYYIFQIFF